jgi:hypothetical protein
LADGALDVDDQPADPADEVMVVVTGVELEPGNRPGRLDPPQQPSVREGVHHVVDGLRRQRPEPSAGAGADRLDVAVRVGSHLGEHSQAGTGDTQADGMKPVARLVHESRPQS